MQLKLTPAEIEAVLSRGERAKSLLENENFLETVDDLSHYHLSALVSAPPGEASRETRDHHHTMHTALREIVGEINSRIAAAEELKIHIDVALEAEDEDL